MTPRPSYPTVRQMARLALPLGTRLEAGALGLGHPVRWARPAGSLSPLFSALNAEEAALMDLRALRASHPGLTLERVVRELGSVGVTAIIVIGSASASARREAERRSLPLFVLPEGAEIARVARAIIRLVTDPEGQEESQAAALYRQLTQRVAAGSDIGTLVSELHQLSGHAVTLDDRSGQPWAQAGIIPPNSSELSRPLFVGDLPEAVLRLRDQPDALDSFSAIVLEQGAAALGLELAKREAVEAAREGTHGDFVTTVLHSDDPERWERRALAADYPLDGQQWAIAAALEDEGALREWMRRALSQAEGLGWQGRGHIAAASDGVPGWRATLLLASEGARDERERQGLHRALRAIAPPALLLAMGEAGHGAEGLRRAVEQAADTLSLGQRLLGAGHDLAYREMGIYRLLGHLQGSEALASFLTATLAPLAAYDRAHGTELVETLRILLEQGGNVSATAKVMHMHRNSLIYRVERIREIAGRNPLDPDDAFELRLALLLAPLR